MPETLRARRTCRTVYADIVDGRLVGDPLERVQIDPAVAAAVRIDGSVGGEEEALARLPAPASFRPN